MNYASSVFIHLPMHLENKLLALSKRFHKIVCPYDCKCNLIKTPLIFRNKCAIKLFKHANSLNTHRLHSLIPKILTYSKKFRQPLALSYRRKSSFIPFVTEMYNKQLSQWSLHIHPLCTLKILKICYFPIYLIFIFYFIFLLAPLSLLLSLLLQTFPDTAISHLLKFIFVRLHNFSHMLLCTNQSQIINQCTIFHPRFPLWMNRFFFTKIYTYYYYYY